MRPATHAGIERHLSSLVESGEFPGAAYALGSREGPVFAGAVGRLALEPREEPLPADPIYDLASLTKPLATALLALRLAEEGLLGLDDPVGAHLEGWSGADRVSATLRDLLAHRSGLPAWEPLYQASPDPGGVLDYLCARPLEQAPGERAVYSCLGYIVLARILERVGGAPLGELFDARVARPLGLRETGFTPPASSLPRIAPTERGNRRERELAAEAGLECEGWPEGVLRGEVHDRNSRHLGGLGGNAGLFGTALEVERLARAYLVPGFLSEEALQAGRSPVEPREPQIRTLGFQSALSPGSAAGTALSPSSFGHTGFTGTSVFVDPEVGRTVVLLTNRVHPEWRPESMNPLRRAFHGAAVSALREQGL